MAYKPAVIKETDDFVVVIANNTKNEFIFDKHMRPYLENHGWAENNKGYLQAGVNGETTLAHHLVFGKPPKGLMYDHRDRNPRNNRDDNFRFVTMMQNQANRRMSKNNVSGFKGVWWCAISKKWRASIKYKRKTIHLGRFSDAVSAALAYDKKARELFRENAATNEDLMALS